MENIDFDKINEARKTLGLGKKATLKEIKSAYRQKAKLHHPDSCGHVSKEGEEVMKEINDAYATLTDYCENYVYSFKKGDVEKEKDAYERYIESFENDWLWGKGANKTNKK